MTLPGACLLLIFTHDRLPALPAQTERAARARRPAPSSALPRQHADPSGSLASAVPSPYLAQPVSLPCTCLCLPDPHGSPTVWGCHRGRQRDARAHGCEVRQGRVLLPASLYRQPAPPVLPVSSELPSPLRGCFRLLGSRQISSAPRSVALLYCKCGCGSLCSGLYEKRSPGKKKKYHTFSFFLLRNLSQTCTSRAQASPLYRPVTPLPDIT